MQTPRTEQVIREKAIGRIAIQSDAVLRVLRASAVRSIREDAVFARTARKKTPAPNPFASPTATAALPPTRFTPRHDSESRVNMRKAPLPNGFGATQLPTVFHQFPSHSQLAVRLRGQSPSGSCHTLPDRAQKNSSQTLFAAPLQPLALPKTRGNRPHHPKNDDQATLSIGFGGLLSDL